MSKEKQNFWCNSCQEDFVANAEKRYKDNSFYPSKIFQFWSADCWRCGKRAIRFITDAKSDPYFRKSKRVKETAKKHWKDILQPDDPNFRFFYGNPDKEKEKKKEDEERNRFNKFKEENPGEYRTTNLTPKG